MLVKNHIIMTRNDNIDMPNKNCRIYNWDGIKMPDEPVKVYNDFNDEEFLGFCKLTKHDNYIIGEFTFKVEDFDKAWKVNCYPALQLGAEMENIRRCKYDDYENDITIIKKCEVECVGITDSNSDPNIRPIAVLNFIK